MKILKFIVDGVRGIIQFMFIISILAVFIIFGALLVPLGIVDEENGKQT